MTTGTVDLSRGIFLARQALALVADFLTEMMRAVQSVATLFLAGEAWLATLERLHLLATETVLLLWQLAGAARSLVTHLLAAVLATI